MIIIAKSHVKRCPECGAVAGYERDSFCHNCGEFFTTIGNRWFDMVNPCTFKNMGSMDIIEEGE